MSTDLIGQLSDEQVMAELGREMSRISKEATFDSWHYTVEEEMPRLCYEIVARREPAEFDGQEISVVEAHVMILLAERLGHWVTRGRTSFDWKPFVPRAMKDYASRTGHGAKKPPTAD